jgi:hypothetical protein
MFGWRFREDGQVCGRHRAKRGQRSQRSWSRALFLVAAPLALSLAVALPAAVSADPCTDVPDTGGTVELPPIGCDYLSPDEVHVIVDGLPPDTTLELAPIHKDFLCDIGYGGCSIPLPPGTCEGIGGGLGGNVDCFSSNLELEITGTGLLDGFSTTVTVQVETEIHTAPRSPGDPVQDFDTEMFRLEGTLVGDPDFAFLQIQAGSLFGLPSPGHTTLTQQLSGDWQVDSFFDVSYEIDFVGAPGSILDGLSGTTNASLEMRSNTNPCDVTDNGSGTVDLPPAGCEYLSRDEVHEIIDGLPVGTTIELAAIHRNFFCGQSPACSIALPPGTCEGPGGSLGGNVDCFQSEAELTIDGTGSLAGFSRTITVQLDTEVHTGPRTPGDPVQSFPNEMVRLEGQLFGDPDFCVLRVRAGDAFGLPSPGLTILTDKGRGRFAVDSFFDVVYEIDYQGCPGSALEGFGGTTQGSLTMETGDPKDAEQTPSLRGGWLWLFATLLAVSSVFAIRRRTTAA